MTFDDYQRAAWRTRNPDLTEDDRLVDAATGLAEEAGEVLSHVRKHRFQGRPLNHESLAEELGDVLWCLAGVASSRGLSLDDIAQGNLAKIASRHPHSGP